MMLRVLLLVYRVSWTD